MVLAVNGWDEPKDQVADFARKHELKHTILLNGSDLASRYKIKWYPTLLWIDRRGEIVQFEDGSVDAATLRSRTKRLIDKKG